MFDEEPPSPTEAQRRARLATPPLDSWGVAELDGYIEELRAEIVRAEAQIARKRSVRSAADAFFKPGAG